MKKKNQRAPSGECKTRIERAEARTEQAEARTEQARTRIESAETRAEQAETRVESAKTRAEQAEARTERAENRSEQAAAALQSLVQKETELGQAITARLIKSIPVKEIANDKNLLEQLTGRQREILQLIAKGQNTKQIAAILKVSPKTVEYHRKKLMTGVNVHDIPGLVRLALREGLISLEN
jgi:DNA-binding NarL/FixJ family response regulator